MILERLVVVIAGCFFGATNAYGATSADAAIVSDEALGVAIDGTLQMQRESFSALRERMIGSVAKPVRFDWRKKSAAVGVLVGDVIELNNFRSLQVGAAFRFMSESLIFTAGAKRVVTWGSDSSRLLALTPYRQHGRPSRWEFEFGVLLPVAEGVATAWPSWFPATQLVLSLTAELRYLLYPQTFSGMKTRQVLRRVLSPSFSQRELGRLDNHVPDAMVVDGARMNVLVGLVTDVYFHEGFFIFQKSMLALPVVAQAAGGTLEFFWEFNLGVGYVF